MGSSGGQWAFAVSVSISCSRFSPRGYWLSFLSCLSHSLGPPALFQSHQWLRKTFYQDPDSPPATGTKATTESNGLWEGGVGRVRSLGSLAVCTSGQESPELGVFPVLSLNNLLCSYGKLTSVSSFSPQKMMMMVVVVVMMR